MPKKYESCICYLCALHVRNVLPDCACDNGPIYDRDACMQCPKRHYCDVTLNPWDYKKDA